jgi:uncharacterized membrane protein
MGQPIAAAKSALQLAATFWFVVAVAGQLTFAFYIAYAYSRAAATGGLAAWSKLMPHGYVAGDPAGNFAVAVHLAFAVLILLGGAFQLLPRIRERAPALHRWNGRVYILLAFTMSLGGLFMVWGRGTVGDMPQHIAISGNALLILLFAAMALKNAVARRFDVHRRWALRLYLAVGGVWFFRIGIMLWLAIHRAPVGFDPKTFTGPFLNCLAFGQYLVPLAVLELYFVAQRSQNASARFAMATSLLVLTVAMGAGIAFTIMGMWLPRVIQ